MIDILEESRVFSTRHITYEEKQAVIECLCDSIRKGKAKIVDRPENYDFLEVYLKIITVLCQIVLVDNKFDE